MDKGEDMSTIGRVEGLWRYPFKGMRGETLAEAFMGFSGIYGDRCYAIRNSAGRKGFPYLNANVQQEMLRYKPKFRHPDRAAVPANLTEAMALAIGVNPVNADEDELLLDIVTPSGTVVAVDDPALLEMLGEGLRGENHLTLVQSDRALTDCRPISLISKQTVQQIDGELDVSIDQRRFRNNILADLSSNSGFAEDELVGRKICIGTSAEIMVLEKDPRCKMISLDPDTGEHNPEVLKHVSQSYDACAGVYCAVLVEGILTEGDPIVVVD